MLLKKAVLSANTGLDAIKRAPIVQYHTDCKCLRIQDITQSKPFSEWGFTIVETRDKDKYLIKQDDIIIARTGATVGVNKYIKQDISSVYNNGLIRLKINDEFIPYYIYLVMQTHLFRNYIQGVSCGTSAQPNLQIGDLLNYDFIAHSFEDQQHIVDSIKKEWFYAA